MRLNELASGIGRVPGLRLLTALPPVPLASGISGLIVAALILMTPNRWFEAIVTALGVPSLIPAATPPLGANARIVTALIFALAVALCAWGVLSLALRYSSRGEGVPRHRRADMHPDAPPRRPIFASDDLGTPLELTETVPADMDDEQLAQEAAFARLRRFASHSDEPADPIEVPEAEPAAEWEPVLVAPEPEPTWNPAPEAAGIWPEPDPLPDPEPIIEAGPAAPQLEAWEEAPPKPVFTVPLRPHAAEETLQPAPASSRAGDDPRETLAGLVARLEQGMARRRRQLTAGYESNGAEPPAEDMDDALREALAALQKLSGRSA